MRLIEVDSLASLTETRCAMNTVSDPTSLTVAEIVQLVSQTKPISEASFWRLKIELGLSPVGVRQRPARYPADCVRTILKHFGAPLAPAAAPVDNLSKESLRIIERMAAQMKRRRENIATAAELRAIKKNGRKQ